MSLLVLKNIFSVVEKEIHFFVFLCVTSSIILHNSILLFVAWFCIYQGLTIDDLEDLLVDIKVYMELEEGKNATFWKVLVPD